MSALERHCVSRGRRARDADELGGQSAARCAQKTPVASRLLWWTTACSWLCRRRLRNMNMHC
eukprot:4724533-Prymnesium_polylepis.1